MLNETDDPFVSTRRNPRAGIILAAFASLLLVGIVHGVFAFGCYLINEHRRLSTFEIAMLWSGDVVGLFWFLRYVVRWQWGMLDEAPRPLPGSKFPLSAWFLVLSMAIGFVCESAMTWSLHQEEQTGFARALPSMCLLHRVTPQVVKGVPVYWKLDGRYRDQAGNSYPVTFYVREHEEIPRLPGPIVQAIRQRLANIALPIVYDPERASRSWIPQLGWDDQNRLHYFSLLILLFQFLFSIMFVLLLSESIKNHKHLPWWTELHGLIPLGCEAFIMALFGGIELYIVRRFCP